MNDFEMLVLMKAERRSDAATPRAASHIEKGVNVIDGLRRVSTARRIPATRIQILIKTVFTISSGA
jgi:hypothetical protein